MTDRQRRYRIRAVRLWLWWRAWWAAYSKRVFAVLLAMAMSYLAVAVIVATQSASSAAAQAQAARGDARSARSAAARIVAVQRAEEAARCDQRAESRASIREAIDVAVDVVARYAELDATERADLSRKVTAGVYDALPPPTDCVQTVPYPSCEAARLVGATPLRRGDPGYSAKLDRDSDGVACE